MPSSVSGIDHEALNRQILEYKRRKDRGCGSVSPAHLGPHLPQPTERKKRRREAQPRLDDDLSPRNHP